MAPRAGHRLGAGLGPAALAYLTRNQGRDADRRLLAAEGLLERDLEIVAQVAAAARPALAAPAAHDIAEHLVEDVGTTAGGEAEISGTAAPALLEGGVTEAIIGGALLIVFQDIVSFVQVLELLLGTLVARVAVGVMLHGELAVSPLELVGARRFADP